MITRKRIALARGFRIWRDKLPLEHRYTTGVAGQRFFASLKNRGVLIASRCSRCDLTYLPPRPYCEKCFEDTDDWVDIKEPGNLYSYTSAYENEEGRSLRKPAVFGLIRFQGVEGGLLHRIEGVSPRKLVLGVKLKPIFKPPSQRKGSINDILFFRPIK